jgi:hypothetical protein
MAGGMTQGVGLEFKPWYCNTEHLTRNAEHFQVLICYQLPICYECVCICVYVSVYEYICVCMGLHGCAPLCVSFYV